jgi:histidinol-phosphatase (PHP family)
MPADYHTHNRLCRHATGDVIDYARVAREKGLTAFGASDHNPMPAAFDAYVDSVRAAAERLAPFPVRLGLECDYLEGQEHWIEELSGLHPWDYLIGAVHYISPGWDVDNPQHVSRFTPDRVEEIWDLYWRKYIACIRTGLFDILAHPDLPKKFGHRPPGDLKRYYVPAVEALADVGAAVEINTAGLRKPVKEAYPAREFVELAVQAGVPVVFSSDAHAPEEVGAGFEEILRMAWEAGVRETALFSGRKRSAEPLSPPKDMTNAE